MEAKVVSDYVIIKLPVDELVNAFNFKEDNQEVYKVKYKWKFAQGVADYLKKYSRDSESGLTAFQEFLDEIFEEMVCNNENYIKALQEEDF